MVGPMEDKESRHIHIQASPRATINYDSAADPLVKNQGKNKDEKKKLEALFEEVNKALSLPTKK